MTTGFSLKTMKNTGVVKVDIDHPRNCEVLFFPTESNLRSRIMPFRSGPSPDTRLAQIQSIPGHRIEIDCEKRTGRIVDLLGEPENRRVFESVRSALAAPGKSQYAGQQISDPLPPKNYDLSPEQIVNWLFWMRRTVESGYGTVVTGKLPTRDELIATDKVRNVNLGGAPVAAYIRPVVDEEAALASV